MHFSRAAAAEANGSKKTIGRIKAVEFGTTKTGKEMFFVTVKASDGKDYRFYYVDGEYFSAKVGRLLAAVGRTPKGDFDLDERFVEALIGKIVACTLERRDGSDYWNGKSIYPANAEAVKEYLAAEAEFTKADQAADAATSDDGLPF